MFYVLDILGTISFAISGVLIAMNKRMDVFGVLIIAFVTSFGGGTLRDILIGDVPVSWMKDMTFFYVILVSTFSAIMFKFKIDYLRKSLFLFDTIGIALYTLVGIGKGLSVGLHPLICIALGTISACFGGVIRDILCNEIPVIFRKEIYATACILGGVLYFVLIKLSVENNMVFIISGLVIIISRVLAVRFKITLPSLYK